VDIYNRIAVFRAERGTSRRELADAVGVNPQTIGYLERGDYNPSLELAMKIAGYFDVAVDLLFSFQPFESVAATLRRADAQGTIATPPSPAAPAEPVDAAHYRGDS
jgi:putative transcriptional regulator